MRTLLFDTTLSGHHLEYLHHYYRGSLDCKNDDFVFCVPEEDFNKQKSKYEWKEAKNISFEFLSDKEINAVKSKRGILSYIAEAKLIAKKSKKVKAERVILTNFIHTIPFLLWLMPPKVKVRGIIYRIYLYGEKNIRYKIENFCYWLMARSSVMDKVFILNDQDSTKKLNDLHRTDKFTFLPDPVPEVDMSNLVNIRNEYNIPKTNKVFLHFGGLTKRKGTLEILKAINLCDREQLKNKTFVFAGRIYKDMAEEFYGLVAIAKQNVQVIIFDEFCSYELLYNLCFSSDVILMPYKQTNLSSGVLGYAAVFDKPVVGSKEGLIGNLIKQNQMGYLLPNISAESIKDSFFYDISLKASDYRFRNTVDEFIRCIFE